MKSFARLLVPGILMALAVLAPSTAWAEAKSQSNTVTVSPVLTLTAPAAASITHDGEDTNQAFTAASWGIESNNAAGATVTFAVSDVFVHSVANSYKADVKLDLALSTSDSGSGWTVTTATDTTDYAAATADLAASVVASSTAAGDAALDLSVTFVSSDHSLLAAGDYAVTVTGTLTAK